MPKFKPQHTRLLFIDKKIREGRYPNCSSLAEEWEVSRKTIQRDLDYLRYQLDAPIEYSAQHRGYFYTEEQYQLPAMDIKDSDLLAVYMAEKLLVQYEGTPIYESLCSVFKKIEQSLPYKYPVDPLSYQSKFTIIPPFSTHVDPAIWELVVECLRKSQQIEILYKTPGKKPEKRVINPYHSVRFEGDWYLVGHCYLRNEVRTFSFSRVKSAQKTGGGFTTPGDFDFKKLSGSHFGVHWADKDLEQVKIRFSSRISEYILERTWHPTQSIKKCKNGDVILSLTVNHYLELKRWVLSWGDDATILEPENFANDIHETLSKSINKYKRG